MSKVCNRRIVTPYAAVGAGLVLHGDRPVTALTGNYQFSNTTTGASFNETDSITVRDTRSTRTAMAVLGGGVKYQVSARWGIRIDARVFIGDNPGSTGLDAFERGRQAESQPTRASRPESTCDSDRRSGGVAR